MPVPGEQSLFREIMEVSSRSNPLDLTRGSIRRSIWIIALPQIITNLVQSLFNLVDMFWVGRLGSEAMAAVAISGTLMLVLFMAILGVGIGASAMVARNIGARNPEGADRVTFNAILLSILMAVPVSVAGYFANRWIFRVMGAEPGVVDIGSVYLRILFEGCVFIFLTFVMNAVLQGAGDALTPMKIMVFALVVNAILDPCLIFGIGPFPRLGIAGAAWTTVFSRALACFIFIYHLASGKLRLALKWKHVMPDAAIIGKILRIGLPASLQLSIRGVMGIIIMSLVTAFGTSAAAAYGVGNRLFMIALMPGFGFGVAAASLVGQNLGAGKPERSWKSAYQAVIYYLAFLMFLTTVFSLFPKFLISVFNTDGDVVQIGTQMLRIISLGLPFLSLSVVLNRSLGGAGDTVSPMIITLISLWGLQIPLAYGLSRLTSLGVSGIFWAASIAQISAGIMAFTWFRKGRWTHITL